MENEVLLKQAMYAVWKAEWLIPFLEKTTRTTYLDVKRDDVVLTGMSILSIDTDYLGERRSCTQVGFLLEDAEYSVKYYTVKKTHEVFISEIVILQGKEKLIEGTLQRDQSTYELETDEDVVTLWSPTFYEMDTFDWSSVLGATLIGTSCALMRVSDNDWNSLDLTEGDLDGGFLKSLEYDADQCVCSYLIDRAPLKLHVVIESFVPPEEEDGLYIEPSIVLGDVDIEKLFSEEELKVLGVSPYLQSVMPTTKKNELHSYALFSADMLESPEGIMYRCYAFGEEEEDIVEVKF